MSKRPSESLTASGSTLAVLIGVVGVIGLCAAGFGYRYRRHAACERTGDTEGTFSYGDRLNLRELTLPDQVPEGAPTWRELRPHVDAKLREWSELRVRACVDRDPEVERCLDEYERALAATIDAWVAGDTSWATQDLDQLVASPQSCIGAVERDD